MAGSTGGQSIPQGLAVEFFKEQLGPELLQATESAASVLLLAGCLKFVTVLRNILPRELVMVIVPLLPQLLKVEHPLIHSYAAICGNVLTAVQDRMPQGWRPRYSREQLGPILLQMIPTLLQLLEVLRVALSPKSSSKISFSWL